MNPGHTALTRTPSRRSRGAASGVRPITPCLAAVASLSQKPWQTHGPQQPLHGAGCQAHSPRPRQVGGDPSTSPGGCADGDSEHQPLHLRGDLHRPARLYALPARVHAVDPIAFQAFAPSFLRGELQIGVLSGGLPGRRRRYRAVPR
jgi:hypothetical protein